MKTQRFIEKAKAKHGDKYDYSLVNYVKNHNKVTIICPVHGEFEQTPHAHLSGSKCKDCVDENKRSTDFIEKAKAKHGDKYDYSLVNYVNNKTKVTIICPVHGEFFQTPNTHLLGCGCKDCGYTNKPTKIYKLTTLEFIEKAKAIHGDKYDYSLVNYVNSRTKITIVCPVHGEFEQSPSGHLTGKGCIDCGFNHHNSNSLEFIEKAKVIHGDKYDYSLVNYVNNEIKVTIICPVHGEFLQRPNNHLKGKGCIVCGYKKLK